MALATGSERLAIHTPSARDRPKPGLRQKLLATGRFLYGMFGALALVALLIGSVTLIELGGEWLKTHGWVAVGVIGLILAFIEWLASWPWWVWLILFAAFIGHRINVQFERLIRHARYFTLQLAESYLTGTLFRQILGHIERLVWHPT